MRLRALVRAIREDDQAALDGLRRLSGSRRVLAPLALTAGAVVMVLSGVRLLLTNWRLTLIQVLPAMWVWLAMLDLKAHVLHGNSFTVLRGPVLIPVNLAIVAVSIAAYFLNASFAYAIKRPGTPDVRGGLAQARARFAPIAIAGVIVGLLLGFSTTIVTRWGHPWFALSLGAVVGLMMVTYVAVPARLIGVESTAGLSRRDRLTASALTGLLSATVCTPPYLLGRLGILMLGSSVLLIPGIVLLCVGATLQAGATGAVRAIKLGSRLQQPLEPPPEAS